MTGTDTGETIAPDRASGLYRKKPVTVSAIRWTGSNFEEVQAFTQGLFRFASPEALQRDPGITAEVYDRLHSTWVGVKDSQWLIRGVRGEYYPIDDDVLRETYDPAPDPIEVPAGGARIVRTGCEGGVLVIAFAPGVPPGRIVKIADATHEASALKVIAVADVTAVKAWHPHDAPAPEAAPGKAARKAWDDWHAGASERGRGKPGYDEQADTDAGWEVAADAGIGASGLREELAEARRELAEHRELAHNLGDVRRIDELTTGNARLSEQERLLVIALSDVREHRDLLIGERDMARREAGRLRELLNEAGIADATPAGSGEARGA
jgi:hypothetical protein